MTPPAEFRINGLHLISGRWFKVTTFAHGTGRVSESAEPREYLTVTLVPTEQR